MKSARILLAGVGLAMFVAGQTLVVDVRELGAKGDGIAKDTKAIQAAIDKIPLAGGTVVVPPGKYLSGTIHLRSNLTLRMERGASLLFSKDDDDFDAYEPLPYKLPAIEEKKDPVVTFVDQYPSERRRRSAPRAWDDTETSYFHYALLAGDGIHNISIEGSGEIDGNRAHRGGPKPIAIKNSQWISIRGITIRNSPNYSVSFLGSDHIEVEGVTIINGYADGIDPDGCRFVRITNCYVDAWDDAICPKASMALGKPRSTEHLVVSNCVLRTSCNHFKFGTESAGDLKNVSLSNCVMLRKDTGRRPLAAVAIESVDGSNIDNIVISNLSIEDAMAPIFIRLGSRGRGMSPPAPGSIHNISIRNVTATGASLASSITGVENGRVKNIRIDGLSVTAAGGVAARDLNVPEAAQGYPDADMFGELPALGLYARHVDGLTLNGVRLRAAQPDGRPSIVLDDVAGVDLYQFESLNVPPHQPTLLFRNVVGALLSGNRLSLPHEIFLSVQGNKSASIALRGNDLREARQAVQQSADVRQGAVSSGGDAH